LSTIFESTKATRPINVFLLCCSHYKTIPKFFKPWIN